MNATALAALSALPKRLLVISFHYPPDGAVGGLRWAGMTRALAELGWSSWVVTAAEGSIDDVPGVVVVRCPRRKTLNDRYVSWRKASARPESPAVPPAALTASQPGSAPGTGAQDRPQAPSALREALTGIGALVAVPDEARGWILRAAGVARRLIREINPSVVVTSGPPHSAHVAGRLACWPSGPARFVDLRDPILSHAFAPFERLNILTRHVIERLTLRSASGVLCVTAESATEIATRFPGIRVSHVPNGVDTSRLPPAVEGDTLFPGLTIAHVGTLYARRDPSVALRAMKLLLDRHPDARSELKLRLIGNLGESFVSKTEELSRALGLAANVDMPGPMPRVEALRVVRRSRITLILAQEQVVQVPAKMYEAAAIAHDIIVVTEHHSASGKEAARLGLSVVAPGDDDTLARLFERAWRGERLNDRGPERLREIDYRAIAARFAGMLEAGAQPAAS